MKYISILLLLFLSINAFSKGGGQEGGGGGVVHDTFIQYGKEVLFFLKNHPQGKEITQRRNLNLCRLKNTLNENLVYVYESEEMIDHRGSIVDAYTYDWAIYIHNSTWKNYIELELNIYHLVLKEMLRSEGTYFDDAINISLEIKNKSINEFYKNQRDFLNWFESGDQCLSEGDLTIIEENTSNNLLTKKHEVPYCDGIINENSNITPADQLLIAAKETNCIPVPSRCSIKTNFSKVGNAKVLEKALFWKGKNIYNIPISKIDLRTGKKVFEYPFKGILNDMVRFKLNDLYYAQICTNRPSDSLEVPTYLTVKTEEVFSSLLDFEILRPDNFLDCPFCKRDNLKIVGLGSKIKVLSTELKTHPGTLSKFIKVRLIENINVPERLKDKSAKPTQEGWITLSSTDMLYYYNHEFDLINDRN